MMRRTDHEPLGGTMHSPPYPPPPPATRPPRWGRFIAWTCAAAVAAFAIAGGIARLTHHNGSGPVADRSACKAALAANYRKAMAGGGKGPTASEPPACVGLDQKTLERITGEVVDEYLNSDQAKKDLGKAFKDGMESALATPPASTSVSPECRTWIKAELLDDTDEIDATPGYQVCGDLSDDELQAAIDAVEKQLEAEHTPGS
jgi:hypothetical protein